LNDRIKSDAFQGDVASNHVPLILWSTAKYHHIKNKPLQNLHIDIIHKIDTKFVLQENNLKHTSEGYKVKQLLPVQ
jgi:hypothetical protein